MANEKVENSQIRVSEKLMYSFRGLVAFLAFTDIGLSIRSFVEKRTFFNEYTQIQIDKNENNAAVTRILGIFYLLKAITVIHCALYPHYKPCLLNPILVIISFSGLMKILSRYVEGDPISNQIERVVSIGVFSCALTILMYLLEVMVYRSAVLDFHIIYSCVLNAVTAAGLIMLPGDFQKHLDEDYDENQELTRQIGFFRNQRKTVTTVRNKSK